MPILSYSDFSVIDTVPGNGLNIFLDGRDGILKLKDVFGHIQPIEQLLSTAAINGYGLVSGGIVVWIEDRDFWISAATYYINGTLYTSPGTLVTLANNTNGNGWNRYDTFAVTNASTAIAIEGTAAETPQRPSVDPTSQVYLTFATVADGGAVAGVTDVTVYTENIEWAWVNQSYTTSNPNATDQVYDGTKSLKICWNGGGNVNIRSGYFWTNGGAADMDNLDSISFAFFGSLNQTNNSFTLGLYNGATGSNGGTKIANLVILNGDYGINFQAQAWQFITIPMSDFVRSAGQGTQFNALLIQNNKMQGCMWWDNIKFQGGIPQGGGGHKYFTFVNADSGSTEALVQGDTINIVGDGGIKTVGSTSGSTKTLTIKSTAKVQQLTDGASIAWNVNNGKVAYVTIAGNRQLAFPTNLTIGDTLVLKVIQGSGGSHALSFASGYNVPSAAAISTPNTSAGEYDIYTFVCSNDVTQLDFIPQQNFAAA